ncbi:hypothetical protein H6B15_00180 [Gemmiger formicilis]|nr:hypothetical protein [Gemmiger formicilis]
MQRRKFLEEIPAVQYGKTFPVCKTHPHTKDKNQASADQACHINFSGPGHDGPLSVIVSCLKKNPERKSVRDFGADEGI